MRCFGYVQLRLGWSRPRTRWRDSCLSAVLGTLEGKEGGWGERSLLKELSWDLDKWQKMHRQMEGMTTHSWCLCHQASLSATIKAKVSRIKWSSLSYKKQTKNTKKNKQKTFKPDGSDLKEVPSLVSLPIKKHAETQSRHFGITSKILKIITINHLGNSTTFGCLNPTKNKVKIQVNFTLKQPEHAKAPT